MTGAAETSLGWVSWQETLLLEMVLMELCQQLQILAQPHQLILV
jgi:hypothetical protein